MANNFQSELTDLLENCKLKSELHKSMDDLDDLAANDFDTFIRGIVNILCNEGDRCDIQDKIGAAKEFCRQLTSQSKLFAPIQLQKWNDLDRDTKDYVKNELMTVLETLNSDGLVESIGNVVTIIAAWSDCIERIVSICINEQSSMHALTASFNILGNIVNQGFDRKMSTDKLVRAFKIGLSPPGPIHDGHSFHDLQIATLSFATKFLRKSIVYQPCRGSGYLNHLCETIMHAKVFELANEEGCIAAVELLIEVLSMQQRMPYGMRKKIRTDWLEMLAAGLHTKLNLICSDTMEMKMATKTVKTFLEKFDRL